MGGAFDRLGGSMLAMLIVVVVVAIGPLCIDVDGKK